MCKIIVIGAVESTAITFVKLLQHGFDVVGLMGHEPINKKYVSGLCDLSSLASKHDIPFFSFQSINAEDALDWASKKSPEIIFAVGFSQLLHKKWFEIAKVGIIGFHPTMLPKGRGRAPIAWSVLERQDAAATFFLMEEKADSGAIFIQHPVDVLDSDDSMDISEKIFKAMNSALEDWLPKLKQGVWNPIPQDESLATWYGKRCPEDGIINWSDTADSIDRLVKAATNPYPGAYSYYSGSKVIIWKSELEHELHIKGVVGRILKKDSKRGVLVQCGVGLLWIINYEFVDDDIEFNVGGKLGFSVEDEIYQIRKSLKLDN